ncbi:hypothetical protein MHBO_005121 [Bonamia ostreae]|uniref:Uncharacterized protein n=1 Tax=Bonamia ostreae TaxID=126728 RepID=A0ABV2AVS2_9EUKA
MRKEQEHASQQEAILTFEKAIDMLEQTISQNVIANNRRLSDLTSAKTLVSVQELSTTVSSHLSLTSFNEEDNKLQILVEKTKLQMDDVNAEMSSVIVDAPMLTFREQVDSIEDAEVTDVK